VNRLLVFGLFFALSALPSWGQALVGKLQTGKATFYANRFNGKRTASGERLRLKALTAAHRTLPFGTEVKVTNAKTGKSVIVRINDRGPHVKGCIIDLTHAAAEKIGLSRKAGHALVTVVPMDIGQGDDGETIPVQPALLMAETSIPSTSTGRTLGAKQGQTPKKSYALQVAAYYCRASAYYDATALREAGYKKVTVHVHCTEKHEELYRVLVGKYADRDKALAAKPKLAKAGWESVVAEL
jgi:rare lipoprotein A